MRAVKMFVKALARRFGVEISRYPPSEPSCVDLFPFWVEQLRGAGPIEVVFDVGANRGQTVSCYRREFPESTIHAFEPGSDAFEVLRQRTATDQKLNVYPWALAETDGLVTLHENAANVTNSLLFNSSRAAQFAPAEMCVHQKDTCLTAMRLDTFCQKQSIAKIDVLKIDAQGYERHILAGAGKLLTPATIRGVIIEVLFVDLYQQQTWCGEAFELLRSCGYRLFGFTEVCFDKTYGWKWADAMFVAN